MLNIRDILFELITCTFNNTPLHTICSIIADIDSLQTSPDLEEGYCRALLCRLRFRKVLPHISYLHIVKLTRLMFEKSLILLKKELIMSCKYMHDYKLHRFARKFKHQLPCWNNYWPTFPNFMQIEGIMNEIC